MSTLEQRQLALLLELDRVCDADREESAMVMDIANLIAGTLQVELAILNLPDEIGENGSSWRMQAVLDQHQLLEKLPLSHINSLMEEVVESPSKDTHLESIPGPPGFPDIHLWLSLMHHGGDILGIMCLGRFGQNFSDTDHRLLNVALTRIDSALRQLHTLRQVKKNHQALQTVLQIDRIRDTSQSMDEMLSRTLAEVCKAIPAEVSYIMLYDRQGNRLELKAITDSQLLSVDESLQQLYKIADQAVHSGDIIHWKNTQALVRAVLSIPLLLGNRIIGVLGVINPRDRADFSVWDGRLFQAIASQLDTAIFERLETQRLRDAFGRNVGEKVMERLLQVTNRDLLQGDRIQITALFSDIRGFTATSSHLDPAIMQEMTNIHLDALSNVILENEGTLDKYLGDGIMAFFNAPERQEDHALRSIRTALAMQVAHQELVMNSWKKMGLPACPIGIGVATGEAIAGNFGSPRHSEYTVIGRDVNLAARLCGIAEGGEVLINNKLYEMVKDFVTAKPLPPATLKGFTDPVPVWQVIKVNP